MLIAYHGHSEFLIETRDGARILTDPFDSHVPYRREKTPCDVVLISHAHNDHSDQSKAEGSPVVIKTGHRVSPAPDVYIYGVEADHDDCGGSARGKTWLYVIEAEGLRAAHLGDLGTTLSQAQADALGSVDLLMLPVGGHFTIDAHAAARVCRQLNPRVVLPMHYRTPQTADWPIAPVDAFLRLMNAEYASQTLPLLRVTAGDIAQAPKIVCLAYPQ